MKFDFKVLIPSTFYEHIFLPIYLNEKIQTQTELRKVKP